MRAHCMEQKLRACRFCRGHCLTRWRLRIGSSREAASGVSMWRIVIVLGLLLCCAGSAAAAGTAEYRFQALVDRDRSAATGCDFESPAGMVHGNELRVYAETDRTQILRVVTEQC